MAVAEAGTIAVEQFDVCCWFRKHQPFAWRRIRCSERCDFGDTGSDGFSHTDLPKTEEWQSSHTIPYFESLADAAMPYLPGKDTAMPHLSGKIAEVEELDD